MDSREKALYHQIHPAKLATDIVSAVVSLYLLWIHELVPGLIIGYAPSIVATVLVIRFADLERYKRSALGEYIKTYMTRNMQAARLVGDTLSKIAAWFNTLPIIVISLLIILLAWLRGKIRPTKT